MDAKEATDKLNRITHGEKIEFPRYLYKYRSFDDKIEIQYNSPISESPDNSQGFLIYREKEICLKKQFQTKKKLQD